MSGDDWKIVENALMRQTLCNLNVDGYEIGLMLMPYSATKNVIMVFVNGKSIEKFCLNDCEERRRFCQPHRHSLLSVSEKKKLKREKKVVREEVEKMTTYYSYYPWWESFRSMKAHFTANNSEITLSE